MIPRFLSQALDGVPLVVYGDGAQSRDFTYVDNVISATLAASDRRLDGPLICNVGCGSAHTVLALAEAVARRRRGRACDDAFGPERSWGGRRPLTRRSPTVHATPSGHGATVLGGRRRLSRGSRAGRWLLVRRDGEAASPDDDSGRVPSVACVLGRKVQPLREQSDCGEGSCACGDAEQRERVH